MNDWLAHGGVAFLTPLALALVIYPIAKRLNRDWIVLLLVALFLSFIVMIIKELGDQQISRNDIIADITGIFFGSAVLAGLFFSGNAAVNKEGHLLLRRRESGDRRFFQTIVPRKRDASLREVLMLAVRFLNFGVNFYTRTANVVADPDTKKLCLELARNEARKVTRLQDTLNTWLPQSLSPRMVEWAQMFICKNDLYARKFSAASSKSEILNYAVSCRNKMKRFYSHFRNTFPELWKRMHLEYLIEEEEEDRKALLAVIAGV
jgi:rubrerythrin